MILCFHMSAATDKADATPTIRKDAKKKQAMEVSLAIGKLFFSSFWICFY